MNHLPPVRWSTFMFLKWQLVERLVERNFLSILHWNNFFYIKYFVVPYSIDVVLTLSLLIWYKDRSIHDQNKIAQSGNGVINAWKYCSWNQNNRACTAPGNLGSTKPTTRGTLGKIQIIYRIRCQWTCLCFVLPFYVTLPLVLFWCFPWLFVTF